MCDSIASGGISLVSMRNAPMLVFVLWYWKRVKVRVAGSLQPDTVVKTARQQTANAVVTIIGIRGIFTIPFAKDRTNLPLGLSRVILPNCTTFTFTRSEVEFTECIFLESSEPGINHLLTEIYDRGSLGCGIGEPVLQHCRRAVDSLASACECPTTDGSDRIGNHVVLG